jgi:tRNA G18 (ribose-2'-O)-methylase SpoU
MADRVPPLEALGLELVLHELQSPINIGMILRIAEVYQFTVSLLDRHGVLDDPQKLPTISDFACGALSRRPVNRLQDASALARLRKSRRLIVTSIGKNARSLLNFHFSPGDLIVLGNEYDGLPDEVAASADVLLHVPTPAAWLPKERSFSPIDPARIESVSRQGQPSLNVAMTAGILCYAAYAQWLAKQEPDTASPGTAAH